MDLNDRETCTILAALRYYQSSGFGDMHRLPADLASIAVHGPSGRVPLDDGEIDSLCERLNIVDAETDSAVRAPTPGAATVQLSFELDAEFVDSVLTGAIDHGYPWFEWSDVEAVPEEAPVDAGYYRAAMVTEYDPDEGVPVEGAEPVRVDAAMIAAGVQRILSGEVEAECVGDIARAVAERDEGLIDADMADCIIQAAVFNDLRYD